jgi:hypothetical protein
MGKKQQTNKPQLFFTKKFRKRKMIGFPHFSSSICECSTIQSFG